MFGGVGAYLKLVLAGLSLRRGVEEVDRENLEDESSAREIFDDRLCIFDAWRRPRCVIHVESDGGEDKGDAVAGRELTILTDYDQRGG
jgi:hypothetical protein